jgi:hypothetical protein
MRTRTTTVGVGHCYVKKGWAKSSVVVESGNKRAVIEIVDPWELKFLRMQLDDIDNYWKSRIEELSR